MSNELLALDDAYVLIDEKRKALYVGESYLRHLPHDAVTQAAFGALCGAAEYIKTQTRLHVTGRQP